MVKVLPARLEDLPLLRKIALDSFIEKFADFNSPENMETYLREAYHMDTLRREWSENGSIIFMAWEGNDAIGFARLRLNPEVEGLLGPSTIELQRLYVHPYHQGKKTGEKLMQRAMEYAKECSVEWMWLGVWEGNPEAQRFYTRLGFEKFSEHVFLMGDDPQTDWLLRVDVRKC